MVKRRISTEYCVHTGSPSYHQSRAGAVSSSTMCFWKKTEAQKYLRSVKRQRPSEPAFIVPQRKLRHFAGVLGPAVAKYVRAVVVQGDYGQGWEDVSTASQPGHAGFVEARQTVKEYRENEPRYPHRIVNRRVLREKFERGEF